MKKQPTPKQEKILRFITDYVHRHQGSPTMRDIAAHFGIAPGTVHDQVQALQKKGFLKKGEFQARGVRVAAAASQVPVLGRVFAGTLHTAFEQVEGYISAESQRNIRGLFALKVKGDSMVDAGIVENDVVLVRQQPTAQDGDIVVALVDDETTIKYFRRRGANIILEPANARYRPIQNPHITLIGKVIEVRRFYE